VEIEVATGGDGTRDLHETEKREKTPTDWNKRQDLTDRRKDGLFGSKHQWREDLSRRRWRSRDLSIDIDKAPWRDPDEHKSAQCASTRV
jgi:hypothetical protein